MVLSDWDCPPVEEPDRLARQIARTCLRRGYAGAAADFDPPARPDRLALLEALSPLLASCGRTLYVPEHYPVAGATILLCTALSGGTLERPALQRLLAELRGWYRARSRRRYF